MRRRGSGRRSRVWIPILFVRRVCLLNWDDLTFFRIFEVLKSRDGISFVYPSRVVGRT